MGLFNAHVFQHAQVLLGIKESIRDWAIWEHDERYIQSYQMELP